MVCDKSESVEERFFVVLVRQRRAVVDFFRTFGDDLHFYLLDGQPTQLDRYSVIMNYGFSVGIGDEDIVNRVFNAACVDDSRCDDDLDIVDGEKSSLACFVETLVCIAAV